MYCLYHPDYTVGLGISPNRALSASRTIPSVRNHTSPLSTNNIPRLVRFVNKITRFFKQSLFWARLRLSAVQANSALQQSKIDFGRGGYCWRNILPLRKNEACFPTRVILSAVELVGRCVASGSRGEAKFGFGRKYFI